MAKMWTLDSEFPVKARKEDEEVAPPEQNQRSAVMVWVLSGHESYRKLLGAHEVWIKKSKPTTIAGFKEVMQQIWNGLTAKYPRSLYASTPGRMQRVIEAEGKQPSTDAWLWY